MQESNEPIKPAMDKPLYRLTIPTADGEFKAVYSDRGLVSLSFPKVTGAGRQAGLGKDVPEQVRRWHQTATRALIRALVAKEPGPLPPLDVSAGTEFQQRVWRELGRIPLGGTRSYGEVARAIGGPKSLRAVGQACGANPIPVLVPCHRVLAANHRLGGFSGGLDWKTRLLGREGSWPAELGLG